MRVVLAAALGFGGGLVARQDAHAQSSATIGNLRDTVRDKATGESVVGATMVATSPALLGEQVTISEEGGQYFITSLPPGMYTLTVYYASGVYTRSNILIQVGKDAVVNLTVDSGNAARPRGETIELTGTAPIVDQGSTKTGLTITDDYTRNFGLLKGSAAKEFASYHLPEQSFLYILHALADSGVSPAKLVTSEEWRMFLMRPADVEHEQLPLHQFRRLGYHVAGSLVQLGLPSSSAREFAERMVA